MTHTHIYLLTYIWRVCSFPFDILGRPWRYDEKVPEFYVILEEKNSQKSSEVEKIREETEGEDTWMETK